MKLFAFSGIGIVVISGGSAPDPGRPRRPRRHRSAGLRFHFRDTIASPLHSQGQRLSTLISSAEIFFALCGM